MYRIYRGLFQCGMKAGNYVMGYRLPEYISGRGFINRLPKMLKEKDFRNDPWRLAYNAFLCGFGRGIAVNKQEHPVPTIMTNEMLMGEIEPKKKSNAIFDKCVENCDPAVMKEVSDNVDKMLLEEAAEEYSKRVSDGHNYRDLTCAFIAGAEWQYQKDRYGFAKLKAKEWMSGYDEGYAKGLNARKEEQL